MAIAHSPAHAGIKSDLAYQKCINVDCGSTYGINEVLTSCNQCGDLLDIVYNWDRIQVPDRMSDFEQMWTRRHEPLRFSGVWRFHELLQFAPADRVITVGEGQTLLQQANSVARYVGIRQGQLYLQYEGMNPSGSFKDNGMSAAFTHAHMVGAKRAACASTGNTSASLAMYCSVTAVFLLLILHKPATSQCPMRMGGIGSLIMGNCTITLN